MNGNKPSIKKNYILNTIYQVLILIVPLVTTPYVSRVLGADGVGVYSYTYSNVSYFLLIGALGSRTYGSREIAYLQNDPEKRSRLFYELVILKSITSLFAIAAYLVYLVFFVAADTKIAALQAIYLVAEGLDIIWLFQGMEDFSRVVFRNTIVKIFNVLLVFALIKTRDDVDRYTLILAGMTLLANLSIWCFVPRYVKRVPLRTLQPFRHLKDEFLLFLPSIAIHVYTYVDKSMIRAFSVNAVENGYYEQSEKIVRVAISVITSLSTVMAPRIAKTFAEGNRALLNSYMRKSFRFTWMLAIPVMLGIMAVSGTFVPVFFGAGYEKVKLLMPLYSILIVFVSMSYILGIQFLIAVGRQNVYTLAVTISAAVNVAMNLVLIPRFASVGATVATITAEGLGAVTMMLYCRRQGLLSVSDMLGDTGQYWLGGGIMFLAVSFVASRLDAGIVPLLAEIAVGITVYLGVLLIAKDPLLLSNLKSALETARRIMGRFRGKN